MPIINQEAMTKWEENNQDSYGKCCVDVARKVMELLDSNPEPLHNGYFPDEQTAHGLICKADHEIKAGGITGFMAGCVAQIVVKCHSRGEEFRKSHNGEEYVGDGVVNHALINIKV